MALDISVHDRFEVPEFAVLKKVDDVDLTGTQMLIKMKYCFMCASFTHRILILVNKINKQTVAAHINPRVQDVVKPV